MAFFIDAAATHRRRIYAWLLSHLAITTQFARSPVFIFFLPPKAVFTLLLGEDVPHSHP